MEGTRKRQLFVDISNIVQGTGETSYEQHTDIESDDDVKSFANHNNTLQEEALEYIRPSTSSSRESSLTTDMSKHQTPSTSHVIATPLQSNNANHQSTPLRLEPSEPSRPTSGLHLSLPSTSGACSSEPSTSTANGSSTTEAVAEAQESSIRTDLSRKRKCQPAKWKANIRKEQRQHGKDYTNRSGQLVSAKAPKLDRRCGRGCGDRCVMAFPNPQRQAIFDSFWKMGWEKHPQYYSKTVVWFNTNINKTLFKSKRSKAIHYMMQNSEGDMMRVCKHFYLDTHGISQSRIKSHLSNIDSVGNPVTPARQPPATKIPEDKLDIVRQHIESFPYLEPHYVRKETKRIFYPRGLSIEKMYELYRTKLVNDGAQNQIVKSWKYREVFNTEYNISFKPPEKDICDKCALYDKKKQAGTVSDDDKRAYDAHQLSKSKTREQRQQDHMNADPTTLVVSFDLENVFALPRTAVSTAFYKRKLNTFNLTARVHRNLRSYCAVWHETISGRSGNDIASAVSILLEEIIKDHQETNHIILWSDSCVPQNRNSHMSYALQQFLQSGASKDVKSITQRFCEPGHSSITDVDNLHSVIERQLPDEIMSPVTLIRLLKTIKPSGLAMFVHMMKSTDFYDFKSRAELHMYSKVKFASAKEIMYNKDLITKLSFCTDMGGQRLTVTVITDRSSRAKTASVVQLSRAARVTTQRKVTEEKARDLRSMLPFMMGDDLRYMKNLVE